MINEEIKIQIKNKGGNLLFEYSSVDNTIKKTLEKAVERRANLWGVDLRGANLRGADLRGVDLWGAKLPESIYFSEIYNLKLFPRKTILRFWKYTIDGRSPYQNAKYEVGKAYIFKSVEKDETLDCAKGGNVATLTWCLQDSIGKSNVELLEVEFRVSDIAAIPYFSDGKFRVKRFKVLRKISRQKGIELMEKISGIKSKK